ncbi:MAG TPA: polymer-forming cytoskeletal protein [Holophagaceae bacterium]
MNPLLSALILALPVLGMGILLSLPALREWLWPEDAKPLPIDGRYAKQDWIFAERFRQIAERWWPDPPAAVALPPGTTQDAVILAERLTTGPGVVLREEVWVRTRLDLGGESQARALLSDGEVQIGPHCSVQRWVHGERRVELGEGSLVQARITSQGAIYLARGCRSHLLSAPAVLWEGPDQPFPCDIPTHVRRWIQRRIIPTAGKVWDIQRQAPAPGRTLFVNGDLILDSEADVDHPLVVRGNLYIRRGALIAGDLKAHGDLVVEGSAVVGNLCCGGRLVVGKGSSIQGCLRGDALVWLGDGVIVGRPDRPEAVVGNRIVLSGEGVVHGRLRALEGWIEVDA